MIPRELTDKIKNLLDAIEKAGLEDLVSGNHAFQTLQRIINTGTSLPDGVKEDPENTEACATCFVQPHLWGWMEDQGRQGEWQEFCISYYESLFNRGKTR